MKLLKVKTSSRMYSTFTHHSLVTIILSKIMMASLNKSQMKWDLFRQYRRKKVTSLSKALCQLYFQFKKTLSSRQNCPLGEKKTVSVIWTYLSCSFDSFIYSLRWQLRATQRRAVLPLATIKVKTFPVPAFFGATPAVTVKRTEKNFFELKKKAKDPRPVNELSTILQRNQWKTIKDHLALRDIWE